MRFVRRQAWVVSFFVLCGFVVTATELNGQRLAGLPFGAGLEGAVAFFQEGSYAEAAALFEELETTFGGEPEFQRLEGRLLPAWAYSVQMTGRADRAVELYERYLQRGEADRRWRSFVLYGLARAKEQVADVGGAIEAYEMFIESGSDRDEAVVSVIRLAELLFRDNDYDAGMKRLMGFIADESIPLHLRSQARLRALRAASEQGDLDQVSALLFHSEWPFDAMPELAVLSFSALQSGDAFLQAGRFNEALGALRLVMPWSWLIEKQAEHLESLRRSLAGWEAGRAKVGVWADYLRELEARAAAQLKTLREGDDYTSAVHLRLGEVYLRLKRHHEAAAVFRFLAQKEGVESEIAAGAHYRWLLAEAGREDWESAHFVGNRFLETYPEHALIPDVRLLLATAWQGQREYELAIEAFSKLLEEFPNHQRAPSWLFRCGLNRAFRGENSEARADFEQFLQQYSDELLYAQVRLWRALTWFFDRDYETALVELTLLRDDLPKGHSLKAEVDFRIASTYYAARQFDAALEAISLFLEDHPGHQREPEARVLRGDILMGMGKNLEASVQFSKVTPEAGPLFAYAVFQRGKILSALGEWELVIEHFDGYVKREDISDKTRIAEALYRIGEAHERLGRLDRALDVFVEGFEHYGNDVSAGEVSGILTGLERLAARITRPTEPASGGEPKQPSPGQQAWFEQERQRALEAKRLTWFARLSRYLASKAARAGDKDTMALRLLEVVEHVPIEALDPEVLADVADYLRQSGFRTASAYYKRILDTFPRSPQQANAFFGLAAIAADNEEWEQASRHLSEFESRFPMHSLMPDAALLAAQVAIERGQFEEAVNGLEHLLTLRQARGRPHAEAQVLLGEAWKRNGRPRRAFAHFQRVYTVYRAYPDLIGRAYIESARLLVQLGDRNAASATLDEMATDDRLEPWAGEMDELREALVKLAENDAVDAREMETPRTPEGGGAR